MKALDWPYHIFCCKRFCKNPATLSSENFLKFLECCQCAKLSYIIDISSEKFVVVFLKIHEIHGMLVVGGGYDQIWMFSGSHGNQPLPYHNSGWGHLPVSKIPETGSIRVAR